MTDNDNITNGPPDLFAAAQDFISVPADVAEMVQFEYRFSALVWLYRSIHTALESETRKLRELGKSGQHLVRGWEAESDDALSESVGLLEHDAAPIAAGTLITACCSALESLLTDLLPPHLNVKRGLMSKTRTLHSLWPDTDAADALLTHVEWLVHRRNSFAHRLVDEGRPWDSDPEATSYTFDHTAVGEAFGHMGEIADLLNGGYDDYARRLPKHSA